MSQYRIMKCERLLRICIWSVYAVVLSDQYAYEAYGVAEFSRDSNSTDCTADVCMVVGSLGTMPGQTSGQDSTPAQAAVYGVQDGNGTMQLLGISSVTRVSVSDMVSVNFIWQDAQLVILVYVRRNTSNRDAMLVHSDGKNTSKFLLAAPDLCNLCRSSATVITGMEVRNAAKLRIQSAHSKWKNLHLGNKMILHKWTTCLHSLTMHCMYTHTFILRVTML